MININTTRSVSLKLAGAEAYTYWTLSADPIPLKSPPCKGKCCYGPPNPCQKPGRPTMPELPPGVFGTGSLLNGQALPTVLSDGKPLGKIPVAGKASSGDFILPPFSVTFAISVNAGVC